jgi:hypothetical protein
VHNLPPTLDQGEPAGVHGSCSTVSECPTDGLIGCCVALHSSVYSCWYGPYIESVEMEYCGHYGVLDGTAHYIGKWSVTVP